MSGRRQRPVIMPMGDLLPSFQALSNDDWELVSEYSCSTFRRSHNTGYTAGTLAVLAQVSRHCRGRMLERGVDDYLMHHTVARGSKTDARDGTWRFEKDGVVVILTSDLDPSDQIAITTFFKDSLPTSGDIRGFVEHRTYDEATEAYAEVLSRFEGCLDEEGRLEVLTASFGSDCCRIFMGIDLQFMPPNRPFLLHCAEKGYAECVARLLSCGWNPGVTGSSGCTILHLAAWTGQSNVFDALPVDVIAKLSDIPNEHDEIPEQTAWSQYCKARGTFEQECAGEFLKIAICCHNARLGTTNACERTFIDAANQELATIGENEPTLTVPRGCDPHEIIHFFTSKSGFSSTVLVASFLMPDSSGNICRVMLDSFQNNPKLRALKLESCGLTEESMHLLAGFLNAKPATEWLIDMLSIAHNPGISDEGCQILASTSNLFLIDTIHMTDIGLTAAGLKLLAESCLSHASSADAAKLPLRKLCLGDNDFSGEVSAPQDYFNISTSNRVLATIADDRETRQEIDPRFAKNYHLTLLFKALSHASITYLDLTGTRLLPEQLEVVCTCVPLHLLDLETFDLYGNNSIGLVQTEILKMVQISSVRGKLKRISFDQVEHPQLWQNCQASFANSRASAKGAQKGSASQKSSHAQRSIVDSTKFFLRDEHVARIGRTSNLNGIRKSGNPTAILQTELGEVFVKDVEDLIEGSGLRVGDLVRFKASYHSKFRCLALQTIKPLAIEASLPSCQERCHVFFYRYEVQQILVLPAQTAACRQFTQFLDLVMSPGPYLESRFPGSVRKGQDRFPSLRADDVDFSSFTDEEVRLIADLRTPESFQDVFGKSRIVNESVRALVRRVFPVLWDLVRGFQAEDARRSSLPDIPSIVEEKRLLQKTPRVCVMSSQPQLESSPYSREECWVFPPLVKQAIANMLESRFLQSAVTVGQRISEGAYLAAVDSTTGCIKGVTQVYTPDRLLKKQLIVVGVAEDMLEQVVGISEKLPIGMVMRPAWLRRHPRWLPVDGIGTPEADAVWRGLFASFDEQGFHDVQTALKSLFESYEPSAGGTLHFVRKADVTDVPEQKQGGIGKTNPAKSAQTSFNPADNSMSWRSGGQAEHNKRLESQPGHNIEPSTRQVERHADGRPKLLLKPRTRPVGN